MLEEILNNPDLAKYMITRRAGQIIFLEGDDSQDLHILVSGHVDIIKGNQKISDISEEGALFGEMSLLDGAPRAASVVAVEHTKIIGFFSPDLMDLIEHSPQLGFKIALRISQLMSDRLRTTLQDYRQTLKRVRDLESKREAAAPGGGVAEEGSVDRQGL